MNKLFLSAGAILVGLYVFGSWTGRSFHFNVFGQNQLGAAITKAQSTGAVAGQGGGGPGVEAAALRAGMIDSGSIPVSPVLNSLTALPGSRPALSPQNPFPVLS